MMTAAFLGMLTGIMIDPGMFIPIAIASYYLRRQAVGWQIVGAAIVGVMAAVALALVTYQSRKAYGDTLFNGVLPFYVVASVLWAAIFCAISRAVVRKGRAS